MAVRCTADPPGAFLISRYGGPTGPDNERSESDEDRSKSGDRWKIMDLLGSGLAPENAQGSLPAHVKTGQSPQHALGTPTIHTQAALSYPILSYG